MYKNLDIQNLCVTLKDESKHSWDEYPKKWHVSSITIGCDESTNGKCLEYGTCACAIRCAEELRKRPLKFFLYQPAQLVFKHLDSGKLESKRLSSANISVYPKDCIIDEDFKNNLLDVTSIDWRIGGVPTVDGVTNRHIVDILNGDMSFVNERADLEIKSSKDWFKKNTGFDFNSFKNSDEYYKTIRKDVEDFIKKINPYVKEELGWELSIQYDPLCTYGCGEWVTSQNYGYGRDGNICMEVEHFWLDIIHWNRTHEPKDMRGIKYRKINYSIPSEYGELDIKKFFKK